MTAQDHIVEALRATDLFGGLGAKTLRRVAAQVKSIDHAAGKEITEQGGGATGFHLIQEGSASVSVAGDRRPDLGPGDYFGEISMIDGQSRSATVTAATPLRTLSLPSWSFRPLLEEEPELARSLLVAMCARVRAAEARELSSGS